ncbi:uncharacterized protein LOC128245081 isoform X2 [Mya arenaria]|uniref:uncharacterized protein LOC128245081 isoform X2 n=1 Tax=Mya arenaria TaxID=6604 RepID=UPI0022E35DDD|nr:uncharacterized protein LOC128245081 isoform X2 [Mya arenaria]
MTAALSEIRDDIKRIKVEVDLKNETCNTHVVKCNKEIDDLEKELKQILEDSMEGFRQEVCKIIDENKDSYSFISFFCEDKSFWVDKEERQINEFVEKSFTGYLYLFSRNFDDKISEVKRQIKEAQYKHTFKHVCMNENKVVLKCITEDLRDVCVPRDEVVGSDELTTQSAGSGCQKTQKTRKELIEALIQAKQELDKAETTRTELCDEVKQVKHDLDNLEKEMEVAQTKILHIKGYYEWTQPAGTVSAKTSKDVVLLADIPTIKMSFTFQDGIQTHVHPSPGKPYKGGKFTGRLVFEGEALLVCRMMKAAFRRGRMFTVSKNGKVILDGVSLFNYKEWSSIFRAPLSHYTQKVKAELMAKGITEEDIDPTEELEETFIVDGLSMIEVVLNS